MYLFICNKQANSNLALKTFNKNVTSFVKQKKS